jgi:hypothetical protein
MKFKKYVVSALIYLFILDEFFFFFFDMFTQEGDRRFELVTSTS